MPLYPPHLHGLTQFSYGRLQGVEAVCGKLKIPPIALGRGNPRIAISNLYRAVGTPRCSNCQRVSLDLSQSQKHVFFWLLFMPHPVGGGVLEWQTLDSSLVLPGQKKGLASLRFSGSICLNVYKAVSLCVVWKGLTIPTVIQPYHTTAVDLEIQSQ